MVVEKNFLIDKKGKNDFLKLVGILAMVVDHVGLVFFPQLLGMRVIGRLALPIFAAGIADGYQYTKNLKMYIVRLVVFGFISQAPYIFLFESYNLNILFTLALSLVLIYSLDKRQYLLLLAILGISFSPQVDYGIYGVIMAAVFYLFRSDKILQLVTLSAITLLYSYYYNDVIQSFAVLGFLMFIYFPKEQIKIILPKHFFYWFFPVHLVILIIIKQLV